ncbi:MAG: glycoside hydrolase family 36 protein [Hyphomicrobiales bacterium]
MDTIESPLPWRLAFAPQDLPAGLRLEQRFEPVEGLLRCTLHNDGPKAWAGAVLRLAADLDAVAVDAFAWIQGRYMQMDALVRAFGTELPEGYDGRYLRETADARTYVSREMVALHVPARPTPSLILGSLRMDRFFLDIELGLAPAETAIATLSLVFDLAGVVLAAGGSLELPPVLISEGRDVRVLVDAYAAAIGREMRARVPDRVPTGWCSWYYFYNRVTEADVVRNLETMRETGHPAEYVQIDDGYQSATGDWLTPNEKFPSGMALLATRIREAGYRPGIWLAPLVLHESSAALREHPEIVLRGHSGEVAFVETWLGRCAILDCTHPEAEAWLRNVISTIVRDWGYEYLKLDALSFAARSPAEVRYHRPGTTAPANLRRGLEIIREAAGDDTFILGCTCHFGPAIGLVDAMRVGPDVKETWANGPNPSVRHAMRLTLMRNWMHGRWWANDPDCLIVRDTDTELTEAEVRFLATGIALSGGMVVASDDLPKLSAERRAMALALFPPAGVAAEPYDPGAAPVPSAWRADLGDGRFLVGALNWTDQPTWVRRDELLRPGETAFDVWNGCLPGMGDTLLRPHEGVLWQVMGRGPTPRVVGDSGSVTHAGLFERQVSGRVQVRNDSGRPRTVAIEARGQVFETGLAPGEMKWFD